MGGTDDRGIERILIATTLILLSLGIVMVYSSSYVLGIARFESGGFFLKKHLFRAGLGLAVMLLMTRIRYIRWIELSRILVIFGFVLLIAVLIWGRSVRGSSRWLGPIQPSELAKLFLVFYLSDYLVRHRDRIRTFRRGFLPPALIVSLTVIAIILQPNLGMVVCISLIAGVMLFIGRVKAGYLVVTVLVAVALVFGLVFGLGYHKERVVEYLNGGEDTQGTGYQSRQSLLSLGSGRAFGVGLGQSRQKMFFLPDPHTDFIFSIIGEELGFAGTLATLCLFLLYAVCALQIAARAQDLQGTFLAYGIAAMVLIPAGMNIGVATGVLPVTGLPLPFISYGGSSLLVTMTATGILINVGRHQKVSDLSYRHAEETHRLGSPTMGRAGRAA